VDVLAEVTATPDVPEDRVRHRRRIDGHVALLRREPLGLGGQEVAAAVGQAPVCPNLVIDGDDPFGKRHQEKLGDIGPDQVEKGRATQTQAKEVLGVHRRHAVERAHAVEIGDGALGDRFESVLGERDIARQRHPVELDSLSRSLRAGHSGRGRDHQLLIIHAFGIERQPCLRVHQPCGPPQGNGLKIGEFAAGQRVNQALIGIKIDLAKGIDGR